MLALIIPPIILVLALAFLIYFFSKRLPTLQARIDRGEIKIDEQGNSNIWKDRAKHATLSLLEKSIRRWKVGLLKAHNQAHELTDSLRKRREASRERLLRSEESKQDHAEEQERFFEEVTRKNNQYKETDGMVGHPVMPQSPLEPSRIHQQQSEPMESISQESPRVSTTQSRFVRTRPSSRTAAGRGFGRSMPTEEEQTAVETVNQSKDQLEALLIERIVTNPKDVEAYERLGDYYLEQESFIDAKECYRQVLKLSPVNRLVKIKIRRLERVLEKR
jgi:tetratricopeptide (TPR) repeat protein